MADRLAIKTKEAYCKIRFGLGPLYLIHRTEVMDANVKTVAVIISLEPQQVTASRYIEAENK